MSEEMIVRHCSPTLAGLKTGNMFSCCFKSVDELRFEIRALNRKLASKGLRVLPLRISEDTALIYVYRPSKLKSDLQCADAVSILSESGYSFQSAERCVVQLISKLKNNAAFPHEVGLFLGYPPEDVMGFIKNNAKCSKCVGCWKVYGDEEKAKKLFAQYKKCTEHYIRKHKNGHAIECLAVAV